MGQKHEQLHISILIISLLLAGTLAGCVGQKEPNGVVAILTDFGAQDYYVGAIKGTVLAAYPQAQVMVTTAEIPAFDVHQAAVTLLFTAQEFPPGTVFLAIVDPGGGAGQRAIAMKTANGQFFVSPDNGLLTLVEQELGATAIHAITNSRMDTATETRLHLSLAGHLPAVCRPSGRWQAYRRCRPGGG